jgi:hypothetical protein
MAAFAKPLLCAGRFISTKFNLKTMYKAFQNKKYYLAFNRFPKTAKKAQGVHKTYSTGFRKWKSDDMITYAIVVGTFRIMFGIKTPNYTCDAGC